MLKPSGGTSVTMTADFVMFGTGNDKTVVPQSSPGLPAGAVAGSSPHATLNKVPSSV